MAGAYDELDRLFENQLTRSAFFVPVAFHVHSPDSHDWGRSPGDAAANPLERLAGVQGPQAHLGAGSPEVEDRPVGHHQGRAPARHAQPAPGVEFREAFAQDTGLEDGSADIVTCSQSLHWMEPEPTFAEAARILRPGGVFAAYDYDWPPMVHWEANRAFAAFMDGVRTLRKKHGIESEQEQWGKDEHVGRMRRSGLFRHVSEISLHNVERCTAERWVGFAQTIGIVLPVLDLGLSDDELGLTALREVAERTLGLEGLPWYVSYRVRVGVK